jgi:hypothetical protein
MFKTFVLRITSQSIVLSMGFATTDAIHDFISQKYALDTILVMKNYSKGLLESEQESRFILSRN